MSLLRACRVIGISDALYRYRPDERGDVLVFAALQEAVERYPAYGISWVSPDRPGDFRSNGRHYAA